MIIRPARYQDRSEIFRLLKQRGIFNKQEVSVALEVFDVSFRPMDAPEYFVYCAENDNEGLVGYICFGPITITDDCYDLYWIAVDENAERKGVGRALLTIMEDESAKRGVRRVYVDTSSTAAYDPARNFYERHGYRLICTLEDFYRPGDHRIIYMKEIRNNLHANVEVAKAGQDSFGY